MRNRYSEEEKIRMVRLHGEGQSVKAICEENNVTKSALYNWIQLYKKRISPKGLVTTHRKTFLLEKHVAYLQRRDDIFTESECSVGSPLNEKLEAVARLKDKFNIRVLCDTLQVKRSTAYHYIYHKPTETQNMQQDEILKSAIREIFEQSKQRFGAKKIRVKLVQRHISTSTRRISRLMKEMGLVCAAPITKRSYPKENMRQYNQNKLNREFTQAAPNHAWISDITYLKANGTKYYLCVVIDLYARKILSHELSRSLTASLATSAFLKAYVRRDRPQSLMFHSDQGSQYTSTSFRSMLYEFKVTQSLSKPGCPYDNAVAESFFSAMKKEELKRGEYESKEELLRAINEYVVFYNDERPHQSLSYMTPNQMEAAFFSQGT